MSRIEDAVIQTIKLRQARGVQKYGTAMDRTDLDRKAWLIHAQEEALDLAIYLQRLIEDDGLKKT